MDRFTAPLTDRPSARSIRRADRSRAQRRRTGRVAALLLAVGAAMTVGSLFLVDVGGAVGSVTVDPSSGLTDGQVVNVSWTGLTPNFSPIIEQCNGAPTNPNTDCDFLTLVVSESNSSGAGSDTFAVFGGQGPSNFFACDTNNPCTIRVADDPNDLTSGAITAVTFSTTATTTTTSSTTSTSTTSTSSTSSTTSTSTTTSPDDSTTTSTTEPDDSDTTSTTLADAEVLGTDVTGGGGGGSSDDGLVLAFTGAALHLPTTLYTGLALLVAGLILRRFAPAAR